MITSFTTSREAAAKTDNAGTLREPGKYICNIVEADTYERKGYQIVRIMIESLPTKQRGTIEFLVAGGKTDFGKNMFDAFCVCAGVENPTFVSAQTKNHRRGIFETETVRGFRCKDLEGKKVGVVLQRVIRDYTDRDGNLKDSIDLQCTKSFNAETEMTASEIVNNAATPTHLARAVEAAMKDRDLRQHKPAEHVPAPTTSDMAATDYDDTPF